MSIAKTEGGQIIISDVQRLQLESGDVAIDTARIAIEASMRASCINGQSTSVSRYNAERDCFEKVVPVENPQCEYSIEADPETLALSYFCAKSGDLCGRRNALDSATADLVNKVAVYSVPRDQS